MSYKDIIKQTVIDPGRAITELGFRAADAMYENTEKAMNAGLAKVPWVTEEGRNVVHEWFEALRTGRNNIRGLVDENFKAVEGFVATL